MKSILLVLVVCVSVFASNNNDDTTRDFSRSSPTKGTNRYYIYITPQAHSQLVNQQRSQRLQAFLRQNMRPVVKRDDESPSLKTNQYIQPRVSRPLILQRATKGNNIDDYKEKTQKAFNRYSPRMKQNSLDQLLGAKVKPVVARPTIIRSATQGNKIDDYKEKTQQLTKVSIRRTTPMKLKSINRQILVKTTNNIQPITRAIIIRTTSNGNKIDDFKEKSRKPTTKAATRKMPVMNPKSYLRDTNSLDRQILLRTTNIVQPNISRPTILRATTKGKQKDDYKEKSQKLTKGSTSLRPRTNKLYQRPVLEDIKKTAPKISTIRRAASVSKMDDFMNKVEKLMGTPKMDKKHPSNPDRQLTDPRIMTFNRATPSLKLDDLKTSNTYYTNPNYQSSNQLTVGRKPLLSASDKTTPMLNTEKTNTIHADYPNQIPFNSQYYYQVQTTPLPTSIPMNYMSSKSEPARTRQQMQNAEMNGYFVPEASLSRPPSASTNRYPDPAPVQNPHTTIKIMDNPIYPGSLTPARYTTNTQTTSGKQSQSSTYNHGKQPATADQLDSQMGTRSKMMPSSVHGTGNHLPNRGDMAFSSNQLPLDTVSAGSRTATNVVTSDNAIDFITAFFNHLQKNIPAKDPYHVPSYNQRGYY